MLKRMLIGLSAVIFTAAVIVVHFIAQLAFRVVFGGIAALVITLTCGEVFAETLNRLFATERFTVELIFGLIMFVPVTVSLPSIVKETSDLVSQTINPKKEAQ